MRILISGGGTGGHVYPALAVATQLTSGRQPIEKPPLDRVPDTHAAAPAPPAESPSPAAVQLLWAGSPDGVEQSLVAQSSIPYRSIQTGQLRGKNPLTALANAGKMAVGIRQSLALIDDYRPNVCLVTGGYVCTPVAIACRLRKVPVLVYLPDMTPGLAVRWLSYLAQRVAVSFPEVTAHFGRKAVVTGYPVRAELLKAVADREVARRRLGQALEIDWDLLGDRNQPLPLLLVFGGSRGARSINQAIWSALPELLKEGQILHVVGTRDWPLLAEHLPRLSEKLAGRYHAVDYLHEEMVWALAAADFVVARAGASTLAEFPVAGLPAILVPLPIAGGHQMDNARKLADAGGAEIVLDEALKKELAPRVVALLRDDDRRHDMQKAMRRLACPQAAQNIAQQLIQLGSG